MARIEPSWRKIMFRKVLIASLLLSGSAYATETPVVDQRQQNQRERIEQGVKSGELTRPETRRLVRGEAQLHRHEARAEADGKVTARERAHLRHDAQRMSKRIHRQKHDGQSR
jgi:hypothetical protein